MKKEVMGTVVSASKQWWLKINTKPLRVIGTDGASYPYVIKVEYHVGGKKYIKRKWIHAGAVVPAAGSKVKVLYQEDRPTKAEIDL